MDRKETSGKDKALPDKGDHPVGGQDRPDIAKHLAAAVVLLCTGLLYVIFIGACIDPGRKVLEISVAGFQLLLVSALVGKLFLANGPSRGKGWFDPFISWTALCSGLSAALFIVLILFVHRNVRSIEFWHTWAWRILLISLVVHATGALALARSGYLRSWLAHIDLERTVCVALISMFVSLVLNFHVEPTNPWFNPLLQFVFAPGFNQAPATGVILAIVTVAVVLFVAHYERAPFLVSPRRAAFFHKSGLAIVIAGMAIFYFDFGLPADPMHYLTNASPGMRLLHGGIPLVDTFSQYGPGPMMATSAVFIGLPPTLGSASILVQCFNLLFFVVLLVGLSRLTSAPVASAILGSAIISVLLGCWGSGYSNLAGAPSNMGFRYLWPAMMVLAISVLPSSRTWSALTAAVSAIAAIWSIETLAATVLIHLSFMLVARIAQRKPRVLLTEVPVALLPPAAALLAFTVLIGLWSGRVPDFETYLRFLSVYNAFSDYWAIIAVNTFWGWVPVLIVLSLVGSLVWKLLLARTTGFGDKADRDLLYGYLPMMVLAAFITLYYLGRSVDNVLLLALLPLSCLVIPSYLNATTGWRSWRLSTWTGFGLITVSIIWGLACGYVYLYRPQSPYHMAFHECRYGGHCSVPELGLTLGRAFEKSEPPIETISYIGPEGKRMIDEAVSLIRSHFKDKKASVFLGTLQGRSLATDLALLQVGKSSRWPISYTFTDELIPQLAERIAAAPIELRDGDPVIIRRDENALGPLEREILRRLRDRTRLCVRESGIFSIVYTVNQNRECERN